MSKFFIPLICAFMTFKFGILTYFSIDMGLPIKMIVLLSFGTVIHLIGTYFLIKSNFFDTSKKIKN